MPFSVFIPCKYLSADFVISNAKFFHFSRKATAGIGIGIATGKAAEAISRQPEAESKISKNLLLGAALAEGTAIFGFVVALLIILFLG